MTAGPHHQSPSPRSTPEVVAEQLRGDILDGTIAPGDRINVRELGRRLRFSHIPIREALRLLEAEGLVDNLPNVGAVAAELSVTELEDVYDLRRMIEPTVAQRAVERSSPDHVSRLRHALEDLERLEGTTDGIDDHFILTHRRFHWELLAPGATPLIERTIHGLWRISERYVHRTGGAAIPVAGQQHVQMVERFERGDGPGVAELLREHLHLTANALLILYGETIN